MVRVSIKTPFESDSSTNDKIHVLKKEWWTSALQMKVRNIKEAHCKNSLMNLNKVVTQPWLCNHLLHFSSFFLGIKRSSSLLSATSRRRSVSKIGCWPIFLSETSLRSWDGYHCNDLNLEDDDYLKFLLLSFRRDPVTPCRTFANFKLP